VTVIAADTARQVEQTGITRSGDMGKHSDGVHIGLLGIRVHEDGVVISQ
jgi:hypothetical protein